MADHAAVIEAARQLGDVSRGGDAQLWTEVLEYFGDQDWDCSAQVSSQGPPGLQQLQPPWVCWLRTLLCVWCAGASGQALAHM